MKHAILMLLVFMAVSCQKDEVAVIDNELLLERSAFPDILPLPTGFQPEGIIIGPEHTFYVGSLVTGSIYKGDLSTGEGSVFITPPPPAMAVGLALDRRSEYLFVAGGLMSAGLVYSYSTGDLVGIFPFGAPFTMFINDVVVTKDAVYFTDSAHPNLYKVPLGQGGELPDPSVVTALPLSGDFSMDPNPMNPFPLGVYANGIDATPNGRTLLLGNTDRGELYKVDPNTGVATLINLNGTLLFWADGILLDGKTLYVVQNFMNQIAVVELTSNYATGEIDNVISGYNMGIPATIDEFGNHLYAVNAHFDIAPPGGIFPDVEFEVVKVPK